MATLYDRIRSRRTELGLTVEELAHKMGYKDKSSISKIENGKADIPQSKIAAFADALETTPAYLMGWDGTARTPKAHPAGVPAAAGDGAGAADRHHCLRHAHYGGAER